MVGIIFISNLKFCPYLNKYLEILESNNIEYEVLYWNRENVSEKQQNNFKPYNKKSNLNKNPIFKLSDFYFFGRWLKKMIQLRRYEKLIVLSTLSGICVSNTLLKKYVGKYIFDIRDYSYESIKPFYEIEDKLINNSNFTCISSNGFKNFLPNDYSYTLVHNFNSNDLKYIKPLIKKNKGSTLNIVWNGTIRYFEHQSSLLNKLKNDERFNIYYHGIGPEYDMFKKYCFENNINNVYFTGEYDNSDKAKILADADILNNSYGTKKENEILYAVSNKYYDGLIFGIPQLVEVNTYKHQKVEELGVGIGLDVNDIKFADMLYDYYFNIDVLKFNMSCEKELSKVIKEDELYKKKIIDFVSN